MTPLDLVNIRPLMDRTLGREDIVIGLIDGPVATDHPAFEDAHIREVSGPWTCSHGQVDNVSCAHGTFVAGILSANRKSIAPAICPGCTLLVTPIFGDTALVGRRMPASNPNELAAAILKCLSSNVRVINLSITLNHSSRQGERDLKYALDKATGQGVIIVAAAGNQARIGSSAITRHPGVIPVVAYDMRGQPMAFSNLGASIGKQGIGAPGEGVTSLGVGHNPLRLTGTSAAAPFVTGLIALLWSLFPDAHMGEIRSALTRRPEHRRPTIIPPLLDGRNAYRSLSMTRELIRTKSNPIKAWLRGATCPR